MMIAAYFWLFVIANIVLIIGTAFLSHKKSIRTAAGWWAGVVIFFLSMIAIEPQLESLPLEIVESGCSTETNVNWDQVHQEAFQKLSWPSLIISFVVAFAAIEVMARITHIPERWLALLFLFLVFSSLWGMSFVFFIRKLGYIFLSSSLGVLLGAMVHTAFVKKFSSN